MLVVVGESGGLNLFPLNELGEFPWRASKKHVIPFESKNLTEDQAIPSQIVFEIRSELYFSYISRVSDGVLYRVLSNLVLLDGERLSYRWLGVEQIGSVYQAIMGFSLQVGTDGVSGCRIERGRYRGAQSGAQ